MARGYKRWFAASAAFAVAAGGAVALASQSGGNRVVHASQQGEANIGTSRGKGTLVLYAAEGYDAAVAAAFQKATGIHVELTDDSTVRSLRRPKRRRPIRTGT